MNNAPTDEMRCFRQIEVVKNKKVEIRSYHPKKPFTFLFKNLIKN
jgi:hypothetical protein